MYFLASPQRRRERLTLRIADFTLSHATILEMKENQIVTEGIFHQANSLTYCCLVTDEVDTHAGRRRKVKN